MQRVSPLCGSNTFSLIPIALSTSHRLVLRLPSSPSRAIGASSSIQFTFHRPVIKRRPFPCLCFTGKSSPDSLKIFRFLSSTCFGLVMVFGIDFFCLGVYFSNFIDVFLISCLKSDFLELIVVFISWCIL